MKEDISKTIVFRFTNKFTKQMILGIEMPYIPFRAITGFYSNFYKGVRLAFIGFDQKQANCRIYFLTEKKKRIIMKFPKGFVMDIPYDVTQKDCDIILHHLEGLRMAHSAKQSSQQNK